jgi:hypothetical protein
VTVAIVVGVIVFAAVVPTAEVVVFVEGVVVMGPVAPPV